MQIQHTLSPAYQQHAAEVLQQIREAEGQILNFEGHIRRLEQRIATLRMHLGTLVGVVEKAEQLPASTVPYALSADGVSLIGEAEVVEPPMPVTEPQQEVPSELA